MRNFSILLLVFALFLNVNLAQAEQKTEDQQSQDKWLIYLYMSGNNLEREHEEATNDLQEMMNTKFESLESDDVAISEEDPNITETNKKSKVLLPISVDDRDFSLSPNIRVLIQAGGCKDWFVDNFQETAINRYVYDSEGIHYLGAFADANMGSASTLEDFLRYGKDVVEKEFQPTRRMFIFWGHGGLVSVCLDEKYPGPFVQGAPLYLNDIRQAFGKVFKASSNNPPFDIIGFDACVRATYENANNIYGFTRYMIASEENEIGSGWYYSDWIQALSENPSMSNKWLGALIVQSTYDQLMKEDPSGADDATFSVTDLSPEKWLPLRNAYNAFNKNYFKAVNKDPYVYTLLGNAASEARHYGASATSGYPGITLDLKDLAEKSKSALLFYGVDPSTSKLLSKNADDLISAIDAAVAYNIHGEVKSGSNGISTYYPLEKNEEDFVRYASQDVTFKYTKELYANLVGVSVASSRNSTAYNGNSRGATRNKSDAQNQKWNEIFDLSSLFNLGVEVLETEDKNYKIYAELTKDQMRRISSIRDNISLGVEEDGNSIFGISGEGLVMLGNTSNTKIELDGDQYRLSSQLKATWPSLNGHLIYADVMEVRGDNFGNVDYMIYGIPIILNDIPCLLRVAYYPSEQKYQIIGARPSSDPRIEESIGRKTSRSLRTTREFFTLKKGDTVSPIFYAFVPAEDEDSDFLKEANVVSANIFGLQVKAVATIGESFTLDEEPTINEQPLDDIDKYLHNFVFYSPRGNCVYSKGIEFEVLDGEVWFAEKIEDLDPEEDDDLDPSASVKFEFDGQEYDIDPDTGKITKDGEEYIVDSRTGEIVKVER